MRATLVAALWLISILAICAMLGAILTPVAAFVALILMAVFAFRS